MSESTHEYDLEHDEPPHIAIVCGGRDFKRSINATIWLSLEFRNFGIDTVYDGGAKGADLFGRAVAKACGLDHCGPYPLPTFIPDWDRWGKRAGHKRNLDMLNAARNKGRVVVLAFPGGRGTADMINKANRAKVKVVQYVEVGYNPTHDPHHLGASNGHDMSIGDHRRQQHRAIQWVKDCVRFHGYVLTGDHKHYCPDWAASSPGGKPTSYLPIDETLDEFEGCNCYGRE